ncbi:MAG: glucosaminidase domain-containing protein [Bacteroidota bacterium]
MNFEKLVTLLLVILWITVCSLPANSNTYDVPTNYIETYKDIAIREMHRSGIPASITLAQGILESSWGKGALARKANNHFGIKCKRYWNGSTFYIEDDDYKDGKLMKSCFRAYDDAEESYVDHTNFLMDNARYQKLFTYERTDYKRWAHGLKKCGYATDKRYAYKLISSIKKYRLDKYDTAPDPSMMLVAINNNTLTSREKLVKNSEPQRPPATPISDLPAPKAFVLPQNYKRGDGLKQMESKGEKERFLQRNAAVLWRR